MQLSKVVQKWIAALRSGEFPQTTGVLHKAGPDGGYCCLGVACELAVKEGIIATPAEVGDNYVYGNIDDSVDMGSYTYLPYIVMRWLCLNNAAGNIIGEESLVHLNDRGISFLDIADIIEEKSGKLFNSACMQKQIEKENKENNG